MKQDLTTHPLSRTEASLVSRWLQEEKSKEVKGGWTVLWKTTPAQIADQYGVKPGDVVTAAKLDVK
jgi:hypothetical protein